MLKCPNCGVEVDSGMKFCMECGAKILQDKKCPSCHALCPVAAKFCAECGYDFSQSAGRSSACELDALRHPGQSVGMATVADRPLLMVEKVQFEKAVQMIFEDGKAQESVSLLEPIYKNHPVNEDILCAFLPALQMADGERARKIIGELSVDLPCAYLSLFDLELKKGDLVQAEETLTAAERLWPDHVLVKCRRVALMYTTAKIAGERSFLIDAMNVLSAMSEPQDKLEKSWWFYLQYLLSKELGDDVPSLTKAFCKEQDVFYAVVKGMFTGDSDSSDSNDGVQLWANGPYWAECNIGASKPEEPGYYFWWGDTVGYMRNAADNGWVSVKDGSEFKFNDDNCSTCNLNNSDLRSNDSIDSSGNLVANLDAATAYLGSPWRMPTDEDFDQMKKRCIISFSKRNGVNGYLVTGKGAYASKSIFLPAAGYGSGSSLDRLGSLGYYWSSTPNADDSYCAWDLYFNSSSFSRYDSYRYYGQSVRPLRGFAK